MNTESIGIEISDDDFEFLQRATGGNVNKALIAIAKISIMKMAKFGKKRKIGQHDAYLGGSSEVFKLYDKLDEIVGSRSRKAINHFAAGKLVNGSGDINKIIENIDLIFNKWFDIEGSKL